MNFLALKTTLNTLFVNVTMAEGVEDVTTAIDNLLGGAQLIGAAVIGIAVALAAFHFVKGGREDWQIGKGKIAGIIIGALMIATATGIKAWVNSMVGFH